MFFHQTIPASSMAIFSFPLPPFTSGVEGITRKNESILLKLDSLSCTGTESERDICRCAPFPYTKHKDWIKLPNFQHI